MKRKLSLLFAICMLFGCLTLLSACNSGEVETGDGGGKILDVEWAKDLDFGGTTLVVSQSINVWDPMTSIENAAKFTMATKASNADTVLNDCYERNESVKKTLNLNVRYEPQDKPFDELAEYILGIITRSERIDLIVNDVYAVVPAATNGYLFNVKTTNVTNYFDFDEECWYDDYMEGLTVDKNKIYAVAGHYFMDVIRSAHCLYVNTDIFEDKCAETYPEVDDFYKDIKAGNFTYDVWWDLIHVAWDDKGKQGVTDEADQLGLIMHSGAGLYPFIFGSQISAFDYSGNEVTVKPNIAEDVETVAKQIAKIMYQNGTLAVTSNDGSLMLDTFTENRALFLSTLWLGSLEQSALQNMDNKAAIVYPKINQYYEYSSYVHDSAEIGYIPATCLNFTAVSAYVQLLNEQSSTIINNYFNNQLKYKYSTVETGPAIEMLDLINETIGSPAYQFLEGPTMLGETKATTLFDCIAVAVRKNNPNNAATLYNGNVDAYKAGLRSLKEKFAKWP